jgi:tetratricopeptide (TPR) repeat protein
MRLREIFIVSKGTKVILAITFTVSLLAILFAFFYYNTKNNAEDPRITKAREFLLEYDKASGILTGFDLFPLLDSAAAVFKSLPDYACSFETGVVYNNKSSALLLMAIYDSTISNYEKKNLLNLSMNYCDSSIATYRHWKAEWEDLTEDEIRAKLKDLMRVDDPGFDKVNFKRVFERRIVNTLAARIETDRRLSVSNTNKGTIYRHLQKQDSALICYREALELWKDNRTAKSNLSVLMGGEPVKPSLIESLFPPDKNKK